MVNRILIVEDEESLLRMLRDSLDMESFAVFTASNGKAALDLAWKKCPELAIVDISLPDMSGWEVCRRLRDDFRTSSVKILVLSAQGGSADTPLMKHLGINHFVRKPFDPGKIGSLVRSLLAPKGASASALPEIGIALG